MKIGIITAMPEETRAVERVCGRRHRTTGGKLAVRSSRLGRHEIVLVEGGMGVANATTAAGALVREELPDLLVSAGFCGGIREGLAVGDAVLANRLVLVSVDGLQEVPATFPAELARITAAGSHEQGRLVSGLFVTTRVIMAKEQLGKLLPAEAPFPVVEMESAAIAQVASSRGIPFVGLRTVSDPHDEELEFSLEEFCDDRMRIRIPRVLFTIARKPRIIPQLMRLSRNSRIAADSLTQVFSQLMAVM